MDTQYFRKENYCKYGNIAQRLIRDLEAGKSAKESAQALGISLQTYYKYKGIASIETGKVFTVPEERKFIERHRRKADEKGSEAVAITLEDREEPTPAKRRPATAISAVPVMPSSHEPSSSATAKSSSSKSTPASVPQEPSTSSSQSTSAVMTDEQPSVATGTTKAQQPKGKKHEKKP